MSASYPAPLGTGSRLPQPRVLRLGLLQDRDIGVGVFPERQKILIRDARLGTISGKRVGSGQAQVRQRADDFVGDNAGVIQNFPEFDGSGGALTGSETGDASQIGRVAVEIHGAGAVRIAELVQSR